MKIYLIGLPGTGKSAVGKRLASFLKYDFVDLDAYIKHKMNMSIDDIFKNYGEAYFRKIESESLSELKEKDNLVVSCGGGIVLNLANKLLMDGYKVYIRSDFNLIKERLANSPNVRPLLKTKTIEEIYNERKELYRFFADFSVNNIYVNTCARIIIKKIEELKNENISS